MTNEELLEMNDKLKKMIDRTSEIFEELVENQGNSIPLSFGNDIQYLYLGRIRDDDGKCRGIRWKKYRLTNKGRVWLASWSVDKVRVPSLTKRMSSNDKEHFLGMQNIGKAAYNVRKELISKKRRIQATAQAVRDFERRHMEKLEDIRGEVFIN